MPLSDHDLSEFLLRVGHDLRASLRAIGAHAELLRRNGRAKELSDSELHLGTIVDGAKKLGAMADGLTGYSLALQIDDRSFQTTGMGAALRAALARLDKEIRDSSAEVTSGELPRVFGDHDRLVQIFEILISNALRHRGAPAPRVGIAAEKRVDDWLFAVQDNGPGIDVSHLEVIFEPFRRRRGNEVKGVAMGLAICRAIVERHGGKVWAESSPGSGSTFFFTLPAIGDQERA